MSDQPRKTFRVPDDFKQSPPPDGELMVAYVDMFSDDDAPAPKLVHVGRDAHGHSLFAPVGYGRRSEVL
jgi:hypothetical protein